MTGWGPWLTLATLGAYHGVNPAMGWLFAVSRGLQERSGRAVALALPPIALGHAVSVGATVALLAAGSAVLSSSALRIGLALLVSGFGLFKLIRPRHPRWVGMRLGFKDLTLWSFVMATAHGAGLMLLPVFLLAEGGAECSACRAPELALTSWSGYLAAVSVHTLSMFVGAAAVAFVVYFKVGLALLRRAWFNLDVLWSLALFGSGAAALLR
ncbi:MAG TPA: hypothetical protein VNN80_29540 [Polyangiaceae bacterium]|nr:hypothetical protein [Polyangiaceae bacterium]